MTERSTDFQCFCVNRPAFWLLLLAAAVTSIDDCLECLHARRYTCWWSVPLDSQSVLRLFLNSKTVLCATQYRTLTQPALQVHPNYTRLYTVPLFTIIPMKIWLQTTHCPLPYHCRGGWHYSTVRHNTTHVSCHRVARPMNACRIMSTVRYTMATWCKMRVFRQETSNGKKPRTFRIALPPWRSPIFDFEAKNQKENSWIFQIDENEPA